MDTINFNGVLPPNVLENVFVYKIIDIYAKFQSRKASVVNHTQKDASNSDASRLLQLIFSLLRLLSLQILDNPHEA